MAGNGISSMMAHQMRSGDDNIFVRGIVEGYTFATFGKVLSYTNGRIDVMCGSLKFTNVEVMVLGVNGWGIKPVPAVGDRVLLVSSQAPIVDLAEFKATETMPAYDASGLKAIPVCDDVMATQLITVDKDKIELTGPNKVTVDNSGVQFEDSNGNKTNTTTDGVSFEDKFGNKVDTTTDGVSFEDKFGNKVDTTTDGVAFEDKNHNKATTTDSGVVLEDLSGNKITTSNSGAELVDKNNNKITAASGGITVTDANSNSVETESGKITLTVNGGSVIEAGTSSVVINGNLEIKK